jgi:hypothetical protein
MSSSACIAFFPALTSKAKLIGDRPVQFHFPSSLSWQPKVIALRLPSSGGGSKPALVSCKMPWQGLNRPRGGLPVIYQAVREQQTIARSASTLQRRAESRSRLAPGRGFPENSELGKSGK